MTARQIIEKLIDDYAAGRMDEAFAACGENFRFHWIAEPGLVKHTARGLDRHGMQDRLVALHDIYDYVSYRPTMIVAEGENVAVQIAIELRHKLSGQTISMACGDFYTVRDGKIVELVEYYDTALGLSVEGPPDA